MLKIIKMFGFRLCCLHLLTSSHLMKLLPFLSVWETEGGWSFNAWTPGWALAMASHTHEHSLSHTHTQTGDAQTQTLGSCISVMSEPKLLRSQAEALSCSSILSSSDSLWAALVFPFSLFTLLSLSLLAPLSLCSLLSSLIPPSSLLPPCFYLSPPLSPVGAASHRETDWNRCLRGRQDMCVCVSMYVCVRALPPQIDSSATCAQLQLPTDGGGIREGRVTGRGREKERREWERWREMKREEGRGKRERIKC